MGADVLALDMNLPFTAARSRNSGYRRLLSLNPDIRFVQFIDGDGEVVAGWMDAARHHLEAYPDCAVVCGRSRASVGEALACGEDALFSAAALNQVGGYRDDLIAGEEMELRLRLRGAGWRIYRMDHEITRYDAAIMCWGQWWRRTVRGGHAFAEGGASPERHWVRHTARAVVWGILLALLIVCLGLIVDPLGWLIAAVYPLQWLRLAIRDRSPQLAFFAAMGKLAEAQGVLKFYFGKMLGRTGRLIEYK